MATNELEKNKNMSDVEYNNIISGLKNMYPTTATDYENSTREEIISGILMMRKNAREKFEILNEERGGRKFRKKNKSSKKRKIKNSRKKRKTANRR